jgi:hypothetical protein
MVKKFRDLVHKFAKMVGIKRHAHDLHALTLRRLILLACGFCIILVIFASWLFYKDPRSKYDLVRPGRRNLPESFRADQDKSLTGEVTKSDVKLELQKLESQLTGLGIYGNFKDDSLSDYKVLQNYLDQPLNQE